MANGNEITFGERLDHLLKSRGINWDDPYGVKEPFAREMIEAGSFPFLINDDLKKRANTVKTSITNHRCCESAANVEGKYLKAYCDFFGCSADYLFGYIDEPTHEKTDIAAATGLSESAIDSIKGLNHEQTEALNDLLQSSNFKWALLDLPKYKKSISDYRGSLVDFQEGIKSLIGEIAEGEPSPASAENRDEASKQLQKASLEWNSLEYGIDTKFREALHDIRRTITEQ